jgi:hypothetical protein
MRVKCQSICAKAASMKRVLNSRHVVSLPANISKMSIGVFDGLLGG